MIRIFDVFVMFPDGNKSYVASFVNDKGGVYNLTSWHMANHGQRNVWDKRLREKAEKDIYIGKSGKYCYVDEDDNVYFTLVDGSPLTSSLQV